MSRDFISNPGAINYVGDSKEEVKEYIDEQLDEAKKHPGSVVCPFDTPYSNGTECLACD